MKKRFLASLCLLLLLLSACTQPQSAQTGTASANPVSESAAQTTVPTVPDTTAAKEPPLFSGSVTTGGLHVHTDVSAYRPRASQSVYTRLSDGPLEKFVPSEDYGAVYPYAAAQLYSSSEDGFSWPCGDYLGFVDAGGRILTDGIYTSIQPATIYDYDAFGDHIRRLPIWIVSRVDPANVHREQNEDGESWVDGTASVGAVSMDGRFMLPCEFVSIFPTEAGLICYRSMNEPDFSVYDLEGRLCFTSESLFSEETPGAVGIDYGEDLYLITLYDKDANSTCWFCDTDGNKVLGPYRAAAAFHEGLACVSLDAENYGYIRKDGSWAISPTFVSYYTSFQNGLTLQKLTDETEVVLDASGNTVFHAEPDVWLSLTPCGFSTERRYGNTTSFYDRAGNLLCEGEEIQWLDAETFYEFKDGDLHVFRPGGAELTIPSYADVYLSAVTIPLDGTLQKGYRGINYDTNQAIFIPEDLSTYTEESADETARFYYDLNDECAEVVWHVLQDGSACIAQNDQGQTLQYRLDLQSSARFMGDRIMLLTSSACQYYDRAGNLLFSYPLNTDD